tara:strand:+ start:48802 stop:49011 length:210 start_codon:yes stop_codon:yes gene_type:complete
MENQTQLSTIEKKVHITDNQELEVPLVVRVVGYNDEINDNINDNKKIALSIVLLSIVVVFGIILIDVYK